MHRWGRRAPRHPTAELQVTGTDNGPGVAGAAETNRTQVLPLWKSQDRNNRRAGSEHYLLLGSVW